MIAAAHRAMVESDADVSPSKAAHLARRFEKALRRKRISFRQFITDETARERVYGSDTGLRCLRGYLDPTGQIAVNNVQRELAQRRRERQCVDTDTTGDLLPHEHVQV